MDFIFTAFDGFFDVVGSFFVSVLFFLFNR